MGTGFLRPWHRPVFRNAGRADPVGYREHRNIRLCICCTDIASTFVKNRSSKCYRINLFGVQLRGLSDVNVYRTVLTKHYYGPVYGRAIGLDRSASNAPRVLLDRLYIPGFAKSEIPARVRVSLHDFIPDNTLHAGGRIALTTSLSPPSPPAEPNGFDFRRMAWFLSIGGVGYTRNPVIPAADDGFVYLGSTIFSVRMRISAIIKALIRGQNGAFAAAIITGDRSDIDPANLMSLRASNLAHLLAISGLHMGLLSGFVFALVRYGLALFPYVCLRIQPKKVAAGIAIGAGAGHLLI